MYLETDFLLALSKDSDWLKARAEEVLEEEEEVATSILSYAELLLLAERYDIDRVRAVANLLEIVPALPEEHAQAILKAARYQEEHGMTTFDALHAGMVDTWDTEVVSSESDYDDLDIERLPLETYGDR